MKTVAVSLLVACVSGCVQSELNVSPGNVPAWSRTPHVAGAGSSVRPAKILPETHFSAGRLYESQGLFDKAMTQYRKAVAANHRYVDAYHRMALLHSRTGNHDLACNAFAKAVEITPNDPILRNNYGYELLLTKRWDEAVTEFKTAVALKPNFKRAHINLGIVQSRIGMYEASLASFKMVVAEPDAYYNLGLMHRAQGRHQLAAGCFQHVLKLNSKFTAAQKQLDELEPILKTLQPVPPTPERFAGTCDAPLTPEDMQISLALATDFMETPSCSPAELVSFGDVPEPMFGLEQAMCQATNDPADIFTLAQDIMSMPHWSDYPEVWDTVVSGNFSMNFQQDDFRLQEFLTIIDNEFRCHEEIETMLWSPEVVTEIPSSRPTMSATVIEGPPVPQGQNNKVVPVKKPVAQPQKTMKPQKKSKISKPHTAVTPKKQSRVTRATRTNRALVVEQPEDTRMLQKLANRPTWAVHTMTANGALVLDEPNETIRYIYGSKANRNLLSYRIVDEDDQPSEFKTEKQHRAAVVLAAMSGLNRELEIVQNEIQCLDNN